ncbi:hypothetical protein [Paenibacillus beijingensis]|uniref:Uncharacterized protein n=1 Tax=Paenibacillus beijingensis TaxID=1126833 RepID=A0A0D5NL04_9BACL|nr:hypothetical protein [Paenibacillus beijingensis]AJY75667.1 hypothetical protein VN24_15255 [Paenibacillus beijingensis]
MLQALGLQGSDTEKCRDAIKEGALVVIAEADANRDGDAAPGRLESAEDVLRASGARDIWLTDN